MTRYATIIIFFLLLEVHALFGGGASSAVTWGGLMLLSLYQLFSRKDDTILHFVEETAGAGSKKKAGFAALFALFLIAGVLLAPSQGMKYALVMFSAVVAVVAVSILDLKKCGGKTEEDKPCEHSITENGLYHISVIFTYVICFYLGEQLATNKTFQSIIFISCFILYDLERKIGKKAFTLPPGSPEHRPYLRKLLNGWIKYWMFFLGAWSIMSMQSNEIFGKGVEHFLLFAFIALVYTVYLHNLNALNTENLLVILFMSAFLAGVAPVTETLSGDTIPHYGQAMMILITLDIGNIYFRRQIGGENITLTPMKKRAVAYVLAGLFIMQVHFVMSDPGMDINRIYVSIMDGGGAGLTSVLDAGDPTASPKHIVPDPENASHSFGDGL